MSAEARQQMMENLESRYERVIARQVSEPIEVAALADESGPAVWHIKEFPGWAASAFQEFNPNTDQVLFCCGYFVVHAHDMFGKPIWYDNEDANGTMIPISLRLKTMKASRDYLAAFLTNEDVADIFVLIQAAKKKIASEVPTAEEVKETSSQETTT